MSCYRMIAFDLDGTLLNSKKQVDVRTREAVRAAISAGKIVAINSGRSLPELQDAVAGLPEIRYAVITSGAEIYDCCERRSVCSFPIPEADVKELFRRTHGCDVMIHLLFRGGAVCRADQLGKMAYYRMGQYEAMFRRAVQLVDDVERYYSETRPEVLKLNFYCPGPEARTSVRTLLSGLKMEIADSETSSIECTAAGVSKGSGLLRLCGLLDVDIRETIAVGDSDNDLEMLKTAGLSVVTANASPAARACADEIVADCDHDGCAEAIERFLM